jgi:hypothetical protein
LLAAKTPGDAPRNGSCHVLFVKLSVRKPAAVHRKMPKLNQNAFRKLQSCHQKQKKYYFQPLANPLFSLP